MSATTKTFASGPMTSPARRVPYTGPGRVPMAARSSGRAAGAQETKAAAHGRQASQGAMRTNTTGRRASLSAATETVLLRVTKCFDLCGVASLSGPKHSFPVLGIGPVRPLGRRAGSAAGFAARYQDLAARLGSVAYPLRRCGTVAMAAGFGRTPKG